MGLVRGIFLRWLVVRWLPQRKERFLDEVEEICQHSKVCYTENENSYNDFWRLIWKNRQKKADKRGEEKQVLQSDELISYPVDLYLLSTTVCTQLF